MGNSVGANDFGGWFRLLTPSSKWGLKLLTVSLGGIISLFWWLAFVQDLPWIASPPWWMAPMAAVVLGFGSILVFADDRLYYDTTGNKYARAFQKRFPSSFIAGRLGLSATEARNLWFMHFNRLRHTKHPDYDLWGRTIQRGYACRVVYYFLCVAKLSFWVSAVILSVEIVTRGVWSYDLLDPSSLWRRVAFVATLGVLWVVVRVKNGVSPNHLTGVWRRFEEINDLNIAWAQLNIPELRTQGTSPGPCEPACQDQPS